MEICLPSENFGKNSDECVDYMVPLSGIIKADIQIKQGESLIIIYYNDDSNLEQSLEYFRDVYRLAWKSPLIGEFIAECIA
jgi:thymidine phosphorylase